MVMRETVQ